MSISAFPFNNIGAAAPAGDPIDLNYSTSSNFGIIVAQVESNRFTGAAYGGGGSDFMRWGTYAFEQFGLGIHTVSDSQVVDVVNLDNNRYRARRISGDPPDDGLLEFLGINVWSAWRGGNPGAPTQRDNIADYTFFINQFGTKSGSFQLQVEEPDGSLTIISDRVMSLSLTRTA